MKLTETRLRQIIKEEVVRVVRPQRLREGEETYGMRTLGSLYASLLADGPGTIRKMKRLVDGEGGIVLASDPDDLQGPVVIKQDLNFPSYSDLNEDLENGDLFRALEGLHTLLYMFGWDPETEVLYGAEAPDFNAIGDRLNTSMNRPDY